MKKQLASMQSQIRDKLTAAFKPVRLDVVDESERHRGHSGWREGGETHFRVIMTAPSFTGESRLSRQRMVNQVLAKELATTVHALAMELKAPDE